MAATKPDILLLQLGDEIQVSIFNDLYSALCQNFEAHYNLIKVSTSAAATNALLKPGPRQPKAVLVVDAGLAKRKNKVVQNKLINYAKTGGTLLFCCLFTSFVPPPNFSAMSRSMELGWGFGDYHRTIFALNPAFQSVFGSEVFATLEKAYSMKTVHLTGVPAEAKVYVPTEASRVQSAVFPPDEVDKSQCPAVLQKHGDGFVGFVGDVNNEAGSQALIMAVLSMSLIQIVPKTCQRLTNPELAANRTPMNDVSDEFQDLPGLVGGCAVCGDTTPVKKCAGCKKVQYCSIDCQKDDWKSHREQCRKPA